jgi:hypothetical protein
MLRRKRDLSAPSLGCRRVVASVFRATEVVVLPSIDQRGEQQIEGNSKIRSRQDPAAVGESYATHLNGHAKHQPS